MSFSQDYKGYQSLKLTLQEYQELYTQHTLKDHDFKENEYLLVLDDDGKIVDKQCFQNDQFRPVRYGTIDNRFIGVIKPRNLQQQLALDMLQDPTTKIKLIKGVYGSGKDYLMLSQALSLIEKGRFNKIIFLRSNITVAELPDIGALPGTADEKLAWTLGPFYDKVGGEDGLQRMIQSDTLEAPPLLHIRGRSFENAIVYVTEAQNMTSELAKLITSRVGGGSELWINADTHQVDKKIFAQDNGVNRMIDRWTGHKLFGYVYLPITERSEVANMANLLD